MVKTMTEQTQGALLAKSASERDDAGNGVHGEMDFVPLTREQAQRLREQEPTVSIWWIVLGQLAVGLVAALVAWVATDKSHVAWSVLYGALAVVIPGALFARGLTSQFSSISPVTAGFGFFVWEAVKIGVSVGMLAAAPRLVADLDWLAMLIGLILALKVYWLALLLRHKRKTA
jgi:ATP synthase protein I